MKATELRIGNLIYNTIGKVDTVNLDALKYLINYPNILCQAKPISLTEEWLLKFGFELFPWGWVKISTSDIGVRITINKHFEREGNKSIKINYVHQLQNLYFALTGEELIIK